MSSSSAIPTPSSASAGSAALSVLNALALIYYALALPLRFVFLQALPWLGWIVFSILLYIVTWLYILVKLALTPILFPIDLLLYRPTLAVLSLLYQLRYILYFVALAGILGSGMGVLSSVLSHKAIPSRNSSGHKDVASVARSAQNASSFESESSKSQPGKPANSRQTSSSSSSAASPAPMKSALKKGQTPNRASNGLDKKYTTIASDNDRFSVAMQALSERRKRMTAVAR